LRERIDSMLYERTALSQKPEETIAHELATLRDAQRIERLQTKLHELAAAVDDALDADDEEKADALQEEGEALGEQLQALEDGLKDYSATAKAAAGSIVTIDRNGQAVIHRGLMRE